MAKWIGNVSMTREGKILEQNDLTLDRMDVNCQPLHPMF